MHQKHVRKQCAAGLRARLAPGGSENRFRRPPGGPKQTLNDPRERLQNERPVFEPPGTEVHGSWRGSGGRGFGEAKLKFSRWA